MRTQIKYLILIILFLLGASWAKSQTYTELRNDLRITKNSSITTFRQDSIFKLNTNRTHFLFNRKIEALNYLYLDSAKNSVKFGYNAGLSDVLLRNVHIGHKAGESSNASDNINIGYRSGLVNSGGNSVNIGSNAGFSGQDYLVNIGSNAGRYGGLGGRNVNIGWDAGLYNNGAYNTLIGHNCAGGSSQITGEGNILLGTDAFSRLTSGNYNIGFGNGTANFLTTGSDNIIIGRGVGDSLNTESNNIFIGPWSGTGINGSNKLCIGTNTLGNYPLIYGEFDNQILKVTGEVYITDTTHINKAVVFPDSTVQLTAFSQDSLNAKLGAKSDSSAVGFLATSNIWTKSNEFRQGILLATNNGFVATPRIYGSPSGPNITTAAGFAINSTGGSWLFSVTSASKIGIGLLSPTYSLSFIGTAAKTIGVERHLTSNTAGNNLTLISGSSTSGATDKNSGNLLLSSGTATGTGFGYISLLTTTAGTTGTTDRVATEKVRITSSGDVLILANTNGIVLKDDAATPHYWRVTINSAGTLVTADIGTTEPQ